MKEEFKLHIKKHLNQELTLKEEIEFAEKFADSKNRIVEEILYDDWQALQIEPASDQHDFTALLHSVHHRIRIAESRVTPIKHLLNLCQKSAAILFIPLLLSFFAYYHYSTKHTLDQKLQYAEIFCPDGVRTRFQLPDGTTGYLNSGARLHYPVVFGDVRRVELTGEAFFDVSHDKTRPFYVKTTKLNIKVLGTKFNVMANSNEEIQEVILQSGSVEIAGNNGKVLTTLKPDEQLILNTRTHIWQKNEVEASQYSAWKEGKLILRNQKMDDVVRRLSRWYNADITITDSRLLDYTFYATFKDEPIEEVLKILALTTPITFKIEKRQADENGTFERKKVTLGIDQTKLKSFENSHN